MQVVIAMYSSTCNGFLERIFVTTWYQ